MRQLFFCSVDDIDGDALAVTLCDGFNDGADFLSNATLSANDLAHIFGGNSQLENRILSVLSLCDRDRVRMIDQLFCHVEQEFLHRETPFN